MANKSEIFGLRKPPTTSYRSLAARIKDAYARDAITSVGSALETLIAVLQQYVADKSVPGPTGIPTTVDELTTQIATTVAAQIAAQSLVYLNDRVGLGNTSATSIPDDTQVDLTWDTEEYDPNNLHTPGVPSKVTIANSGNYIIVGRITYSPTFLPGKLLMALINVNGSKIAQSSGSSNDVLYTTVEVVRTYPLVAGDYVELIAFQKSGATLDTATTSKNTGFSVTRIA